jgi:phosphoribosyl-dephospho-CoA transferase
MNWQRHQLVWLNAAGWQAVLAGRADEPPWTDGARDCLQHWAAHGLPLVVTRQPAVQPDGGAAQGGPPDGWALSTLTLGLAAPLRWNRQRLFVRVDAATVQGVGAFPLAVAIGPALPDSAAEDWRALCAALAAVGLVPRAHGSYGWQVLTGLGCVREGLSDIDLLLPCTTASQADAAVALLAQADATLPRLDGECVFPDGAAVAWREWAAWRAGAVRRMLVKRLHGAALEGADPGAVFA